LLESEGLIIVDTYKKKICPSYYQANFERNCTRDGMLGGLAANLQRSRFRRKKSVPYEKITAAMEKAFEEKNYDIMLPA